MKFSRQSLRHGSILMITMLVAALIALVLGSYLSLGLSTARFANRTFYSNASFNLAEAGAEEAVWSFNRPTNGASDGWTAWSNNGNDAWQKFDGFTFGANATGSVKVYVENYNPPVGSVSPKVIALATVAPGADAPVTKMIELTLQQRSFFAGGLVAQDAVTLNGSHVTVDSWNSDPTNNPAAPPVPYNSTVRDDRGGVAGTSVSTDNADIWGYVATGGAQPQIGTSGSIRGVNTPASVTVDPSLISTDFVANFPTVTAPAGGTPIATFGSTLGTSGAATTWRCPDLTLSGNQTLTILGNVTLIITASPGTKAINISGGAAIVIPTGSSLIVYCEGDAAISGGSGFNNSNVQPISCQFYGTNQSAGGQNITVSGNGDLRCALYAPNGEVTISGNGSIYGSIVAHDITLSGSADFHYDESLPTYGNASYGVAQWREITTGAERSSYLPLFNGW